MNKKTDVKPQHTPTTWQVEKNQYNDIVITNGEATLVHMSKSVAISESEKQANAAFIVRVVNAHQELLNFAKDHLAELKEDGYETTAFYNHLQALIIKAEGKEWL